jgi:hypothetical protein
MKILRLISPSTAGLTKSEWTNYFNQDLILKPNSKIGLLNASIPVNLKTITIDNSNDTFYARTKDKQTLKNMKIPHGNYEPSEFMQIFESVFNEQLTFKSKSDIGFELKLSTTSETDGDHLNITILRNARESLKNYINSKITVGASDVLTRTGAAASNNCFLYSSFPILTSCSFIRTTILAPEAMIMGITNKYEGTTNLDNTMLNYAIGINTTGPNVVYFYIDENGNTILTQVQPEEDDIISIDIYQNKIWYNVYRGDDTHTLSSIAFQNPQENYNSVIALRDPGASCSLPQLIYSGIVKELGDDLVYTDNKLSYLQKSVELPIDYDPLAAPPVPPPNLSQGKFTLIFSTTALKNTLGFTSSILSFTGEENTFKASSSINELVIPKNVLVEIQDLFLDTMDAGLGVQRNLLAVIPQLNLRENNLIYEATSTPIMLDLNNAYQMNLRSLHVRLLTRSDENDLLIDISEQCELTLLLD